MDAPGKPKKNLLRYLRWRDLIVILLGLALGWWLNHRWLREPTDYEKWQARPQLTPVGNTEPGKSGLWPCFFTVPPTAVDPPVASGSVADCRQLLPDGKKMDLYEVAVVGAFVHIKTDLYVPDTIPLAFTRMVMPPSDWDRRNKIYLAHVYDPFLFGDRLPYTFLDWQLPDKQSVHFKRVSQGTGFADAVYEAESWTPAFAGSRVKWNGWGWDLSLEDGTTYLSPEAYNATRPQQGSLVGIFDNDGNEVRLSRRANGDLTEIKSPHGGWIRFRYDDTGRMIQANDSIGESVAYDYDSNNRLTAARYSTGETVKYSYDSSDRVLTVEDTPGGIILENKYNPGGLVIEQTLRAGSTSTYSFQHAVDKQARSIQVNIIDSQANITQVKTQFAHNIEVHYTVEKLAPGSKRH